MVEVITYHPFPSSDFSPSKNTDAFPDDFRLERGREGQPEAEDDRDEIRETAAE
jgi:hypothetical protein